LADLIIRTDANVAIGTGHVMRCMALAQAWCDAGGRAVFAMAQTTPAVEERLRSEGFERALIDVRVGSREDAIETASLASQYIAPWVVVDGYEFGAEYQAGLKRHGVRVLFIDDNGNAGPYSADIVLNQNIHASERLYSDREPSTKLLLGPGFVLLRREFAPWREWKREIPAIGRRILITMGGSDPDNFAELVLRASRLVGVERLEIVAVAGGSNPHWESLQNMAGEGEGLVQVYRDVSDMAELMAWADVAVSAAGTTCWEMCLLGLPALLIAVADNQQALSQELDRLGCAIRLGNGQDLSAERIASQLGRLLNSSETRSSLSQDSRQLVDSKGASRVVSAMLGDRSSSTA
jgi:UDP-2,4-diacetamido-2,4,6-trideoxy-beta-L-altropyranose hydrolase